MAIIAVGYPGSPTSANPWDWWPVVGFALSLWFIRSVLGRDKSTFRDQLAQKIAAYSPVAAARGILQCSSELCKADRR